VGHGILSEDCQAFLILLNIIISDANLIKIINTCSQPYQLQNHLETTKSFNFNWIKGLKKMFKRCMVGFSSEPPCFQCWEPLVKRQHKVEGGLRLKINCIFVAFVLPSSGIILTIHYTTYGFYKIKPLDDMMNATKMLSIFTLIALISIEHSISLSISVVWWHHFCLIF